MKQEIIRVERLILKELGYVVALLLEHPHKYVIQFIKSMVRSPQSRVAELAQRAWNYLNDATRTVLCCKYAPHKITTASIYLAAHDMKIKLPTTPPWWLLFDTELADLQSIARTILALYGQPPARYISVPAKKDSNLFGLATPLGMPTPLRSPVSDEDVQTAHANAQDRDTAIDSERISEMLKEDGGNARSEHAVPSSLLAAAKNLPASFSSVEATRPRSRSPKRKVVQLKVSVRGRA
jgi:hypothetical protein